MSERNSKGRRQSAGPSAAALPEAAEHNNESPKNNLKRARQDPARSSAGAASTKAGAHAPQQSRPQRPQSKSADASGSKGGPVDVGRAAEIAGIGHDGRRFLIAQAAYFRAERRGFASGGELRDWLDAEADIDGRLQQMAVQESPGGRSNEHC